MEAASTVLFLLWIGILFALMLVVAERFFCPSLELISEYLRLPPCVAGATLLSFGNGAPDVFTQLAAISQGDSDVANPGAISMALSEPLGSGLFVGNIVFALVVFFSGLREVRVQRSYFLKDCLFYLGGVATVFAVLLHGEVMVWEVALLAAYYVAFIVATVLLSRGDEPVYADPRLHEVPHRLMPADSFMRESFRRVTDATTPSGGSDDAEAPLLPPRSTLERIDEAAPSFCSEADDDSYDSPPHLHPHLGLTLEGPPPAAAAAAAGPSAPLNGHSSPPPLLPSAFTSFTGRTTSGGPAPGPAGGPPGSEGGCSHCWGGAGSGSFSRLPSIKRDLSGKPPGGMERLWRRMERPGLALLSVFIPRVAIDTHARYRKTFAVLLPPLLPSLVAWSQGWCDERAAPGGLWRQPWWRLATTGGLLVAVAAVRYYPRKGHLHGYAAGVATVVVFCEAMFLLDASAGELVSAAVALGQIYGISPSLLGATLLAWGNSVSDLVSNITLARDGLPSMAITACFASPLFVLLAGLVTSLTYATRHGNMQLPHDLALRVLYGCSSTILLMWAVVVPLVFRFRLTRRVAVLAVAVYVVYQVVYISAVIHDARM